jgi:hypothetical protein
MLLDLVEEVWIVKASKDFTDHCLLVSGEELSHPMRRDVPVRVHLRSQGIVERQYELALLIG